MTTPHISQFPEGFTWGVATSSFQIEGSTFVDNRGESIWDRFCATEGKVKNGDNGEVACDHYNRFEEDIALMKSLGVKAYRFSIAWPRILPTGTEKEPIEEGLAFYDRLVDALLEAGIEPWVTLYHWDLPQALQDEGGWLNRRIVERFVHYTEIVAKRLGNRVKNWITINEPWVICHLGYGVGEHAPGLKSIRHSLLAAHHVLLAHGAVVPVIRKWYRVPKSELPSICVHLSLHLKVRGTSKPIALLMASSIAGIWTPFLVVAIQQTWSRSMQRRESSTIIQRGFWTETWRPFPYKLISWASTITLGR